MGTPRLRLGDFLLRMILSNGRRIGLVGEDNVPALARIRLEIAGKMLLSQFK